MAPKMSPLWCKSFSASPRVTLHPQGDISACHPKPRAPFIWCVQMSFHNSLQSTFNIYGYLMWHRHSISIKVSHWMFCVQFYMSCSKCVISKYVVVSDNKLLKNIYLVMRLSIARLINFYQKYTNFTLVSIYMYYFGLESKKEVKFITKCNAKYII